MRCQRSGAFGTDADGTRGDVTQITLLDGGRSYLRSRVPAGVTQRLDGHEAEPEGCPCPVSLGHPWHGAGWGAGKLMVVTEFDLSKNFIGFVGHVPAW